MLLTKATGIIIFLRQDSFVFNERTDEHIEPCDVLLGLRILSDEGVDAVPERLVLTSPACEHFRNIDS